MSGRHAISHDNSRQAAHGLRANAEHAQSLRRLPRKRPLLFVLQGPDQGAVFPIPHGGLIGRDSKSDIVLGSDTVSREHARLTLHGGQAYVADLGSSSGTFVNGERAVGRTRLADGDYLQFGATLLKFSLVDELEENALCTLYELTLRDPLTRLYNRRYFDERLRSEFSFAARQRTPLALLIVDLDHFKRVNDTHGHPTGDRVLSLVASSIGRMMRPEDVLARYGGEEFVVIARHTSLRNAEILGERIRRAVAGLSVELEHGVLGISASVGVASIGPGTFPPDAELLLGAADEALYRAKQGGRNRVVTAHPNRSLGNAARCDRPTLPPNSAP